MRWTKFITMTGFTMKTMALAYLRSTSPRSSTQLRSSSSSQTISSWHGYYFNPNMVHTFTKYSSCQFLGWIFYYSGPHFGTEADNTIFEDTMYEHPMRSWEFWCGDGIYNSCYGVLTRYILQAGQVFTRMQVAVNAWIGHYRQRVEHVMHTIKAHNMWRMPFRGSYPMLQACLHLTIHMSAAKIKHAWADEAFHKYPGFHTGPWPRAP
jgi:hypothetical protein